MFPPPPLSGPCFDVLSPDSLLPRIGEELRKLELEPEAFEFSHTRSGGITPHHHAHFCCAAAHRLGIGSSPRNVKVTRSALSDGARGVAVVVRYYV